MAKAGKEGTTGRRTTKAPAGKRTNESKKEDPFNKLQVVERLLREVAEELQENKGKPSVSDFIRLLEVQKALKRDEPARIEVTWVDPITPSEESGG